MAAKEGTNRATIVLHNVSRRYHIQEIWYYSLPQQHSTTTIRAATIVLVEQQQSATQLLKAPVGRTVAWTQDSLVGDTKAISFDECSQDGSR